jgi:hypothetical protein
VARGGARAGAGRPKGAATKKTREIADAAIQSGESPLDFLLRIMRTSTDPARQLEAAKAAAPYVHPRLATVDVGNKNDEAFKIASRIELVPVEPTSEA